MLRQLLAELEMPVYLVPGNHDDRGTSVASSAIATTCRGGRIALRVEDHPVRLIGLDTVVPGCRGEFASAAGPG
jgi:3',5'-cyclic AMP phosphodiesterase CpdA